jgi:SAM-dependent methyltransferase
MERHEYDTLYQFETDYWWFRMLHGVLADIVSGLDLGKSPRILDAGCGTGGNLAKLAQHSRRPQVFGFDYSAYASAFWAQRGITTACIGSINDIPYASGAFDLAMSIDVLESDGVDERRACAELLRVVRPGGYALVTVPAFTWLMTEEHHQAVHASRRYTRHSALALWDGLPARIVRATYLFALIFPAVAAYRLLLRLRPRDASRPPRSELNPLPTWLNAALTLYNQPERALLRAGVPMPFGSSVLMLVQKL